MDYKMDGFMTWLYENSLHAGKQLFELNREEFTDVRARKREQLTRCLGIDILDQIACPEPAILEREEYLESHRVKYMSMQILPELTMPFYIVEPEKPLLDSNGHPKGFLYCHGHGEGGARDCFVRREPTAYHKNIPLVLAKRGYTVFMPEPAGFGDFNIQHYQGDESACFPITTQLLMYGITTVGLRVFQARKLADYMEEQEITCYAIGGISGGGTVTTLYAALDDRMKATVISGYICMLKKSIMAMHHCVDNFIPEILKIGEIPYITSMAVPKPLYIASGIHDPIFPIEGVKEAIKIIEQIYQKQSDKNLVTSELFNGEHEFSVNFIDWLDAVL